MKKATTECYCALIFVSIFEGGGGVDLAMFTGIVVLLWTTEEYVKQHLFIMLC